MKSFSVYRRTDVILIIISEEDIPFQNLRMDHYVTNVKQSVSYLYVLGHFIRYVINNTRAINIKGQIARYIFQICGVFNYY